VLLVELWLLKVLVEVLQLLVLLHVLLVELWLL
jgi:hypothetical protein